MEQDTKLTKKPQNMKSLEEYLKVYTQNTKGNENLLNEEKGQGHLVNYITHSQLMQILKQRAVLVHNNKK